MEFWNSMYSPTNNQNQHLFLKLITGSSYAGVAGTGTTINLAFKTYTNYEDIAEDVKKLKAYTDMICQDQDKESAYL